MPYRGVVTIDDIADLVETALGANGTFTGIFGANFFFDRAPDTVGYPYAVYHVQAAAAELCFDDVYFQAYTVTIAAYVPQGADASPADPPGVQQALFTALATEAAENAIKATGLRNPSEQVLHVTVQTPTGAFDRKLRDGRDVFAAGLSVQILVQGDRSLS